MSLSDMTSRVRAALGLTQEEFAIRLKVTKAAVQFWENGQRRPAPRQLRKMAELAPKFAEELEDAAHRFRWHQGGQAEWRVLAMLRRAGLSADLVARAGRLAEKKGIDASILLSKAIEVGLDVLGTPSSTKQRSLEDLRTSADRAMTTLQSKAEEAREHQRTDHQRERQRGIKTA